MIMSKYQEVLEFLMENGVQLNKEQTDDLKDIFVDNSIILTESTISIKNSKMKITVNESSTGTNFKMDPYIKLYTGTHAANPKKIIRVKLRSLEPEIHRGPGEVWELNAPDKKLLNKIMHNPSENDKSKTDWDYTLDMLAKECKVDRKYFEDMFPDGCPDFKKVKDLKKGKKN